MEAQIKALELELSKERQTRQDKEQEVGRLLFYFFSHTRYFFNRSRILLNDFRCFLILQVSQLIKNGVCCMATIFSCHKIFCFLF